jgi:hypothetical protein
VRVGGGGCLVVSVVGWWVGCGWWERVVVGRCLLVVLVGLGAAGVWLPKAFEREHGASKVMNPRKQN